MIVHVIVVLDRIACVAWRFWLGALSNKGRRGQRNREEIGGEQLEKPPARTGGFFESVRQPAYGSFRLVQKKPVFVQANSNSGQGHVLHYITSFCVVFRLSTLYF